MTYPETIQYLESFINYEKILNYPYKESLRLERVKDFLAIIDNPQDSLNCIHIAGTKGKGSTCAFITYILRQAGYKVGLYTSPHLSDFRERIRILWHQVPSARGTRCQVQEAPGARLDSHQVQEDFEGMITYDELTRLVERLKPAIQTYNKNSPYGPLSFFEIYTALAFVYFQEEKVDFAVLETGLGGRLDATNVVNPLVVGITPISYEHTQKLGNTLREIAAEKAGIIKIPNPTSCRTPSTKWHSVRGKSHLVPNTQHKMALGARQISNPIVITAPQEKEVIEVIRNRCKEVKAKLYEVNKDIFYEKTNDGFNVTGIFGEYPCLKTNLLGKHQLINATVAIGIVEALQLYNIHVGIDSIRDGLYRTVWPGRCEVVSCNPLTVLDGAQNIASIRALKETIKENFSASGKYKRLLLVLGISNDKDIKGICQELYDLADKIILTKADNPRATKPEILAQYFIGKDVQITHNVQKAKNRASQLIKKEDLILVCGSLFVVGEFRDGKIRSQ